MAVERRLREQLQRNSLEESKKEQDWYLQMVEKNRVGNKIKEKEINKKGQLGNSSKWVPKEFKQRDIGVVDGRKESTNFSQKTSGMGNKSTVCLNSVLSNIL